MGKIVIIIVVLIAAIFAVITLSVYKSTPKVPEVLSDRGLEYDIEYLVSYSLNQAIKQIPGSVDDDTLQEFTNYEVLAGGYIDTLLYDFDYKGDSTKVYIHSNVSMITPEQDTIYGEGEAEVQLLWSSEYIEHAVIIGGPASDNKANKVELKKCFFVHMIAYTEISTQMLILKLKKGRRTLVSSKVILQPQVKLKYQVMLKTLLLVEQWKNMLI